MDKNQVTNTVHEIPSFDIDKIQNPLGDRYSVRK